MTTCIFGFFLQIVKTMRSLLLRMLSKLVGPVTAPVLRRAKHDYFPRTLKLHNGEKVDFFFFYSGDQRTDHFSGLVIVIKST